MLTNATNNVTITQSLFFIAGLLLFCSLGRGFFFLSQACTLQNVFQRVVSFVTGVFINLTIRLRPGVLPGPGLGPRGGILHGEAIENRVLVNPAEALDHVQVLGRSAEARLVREIRGVYYQCITIPMAHGISQPEANG